MRDLSEWLREWLIQFAVVASAGMLWLIAQRLRLLLEELQGLREFLVRAEEKLIRG